MGRRDDLSTGSRRIYWRPCGPSRAGLGGSVFAEALYEAADSMGFQSMLDLVDEQDGSTAQPLVLNRKSGQPP
jgi:hypothetical protein